NQERALNLSILTMSGPGEFPNMMELDFTQNSLHPRLIPKELRTECIYLVDILFFRKI
ncbi:hypothetical protein ROZALSC1DRAFT_17761, partial [Rozella allomycis CSF55]